MFQNMQKKMQEEIGDEYESMQLQVQESAGRVAELVKEIARLESEKKEQIASEGESSSQMEDVEVEEKVAELSSELEARTQELEQYRQTCTEWNNWAEARNTEYQQLLEAYNGYVEAYNNLQAEQKPAEVSSEEEEESMLICDWPTKLPKDVIVGQMEDTGDLLRDDFFQPFKPEFEESQRGGQILVDTENYQRVQRGESWDWPGQTG